MDTNHKVSVEYSQKTTLSANKAFQVIVGVATLFLLAKMFFRGMFSTAFFSFVGYPQSGDGMGSMALVALIIDTLALVGLGTLTVYRFLWSFIVGIHEYWANAVARGKAVAEGGQQAAAIGVAAAMSSAASSVAQSVTNAAKPAKPSVDDYLRRLVGNDREFKKITDDHEKRLAALEIAQGLREPPPPPPLTVEEELALLKAKLSELEETKATTKRGTAK